MQFNKTPSFKAVIMAPTMKKYLRSPMKAIRFDDFRKEIEPMYFNDFYIEPVGKDVLQIGITKSDSVDTYLHSKAFKLNKKGKNFLKGMKMLNQAMRKNREENNIPGLLGYANLDELPPKAAAERVIDAAKFFNETVVGLN